MLSYFLKSKKWNIFWTLFCEGFEAFLKKVLVAKQQMKPDFIIYNLQNKINPIFRPGLSKVLWMTVFGDIYTCDPFSQWENHFEGQHLSVFFSLRQYSSIASSLFSHWKRNPVERHINDMWGFLWHSCKEINHYFETYFDSLCSWCFENDHAHCEVDWTVRCSLSLSLDCGWRTSFETVNEKLRYK